ncbi:hypothetical protein BsWGS_28330 [Bradybaena similaris]
MSQREEYQRLLGLIKQWNVDHYDIFELTPPNQDLEFHGVVRFFFQGGIGASVITKCIRVSSTASTREVIDVLIEKFRPDMRMLSQHKYALYEVHVNGEERRLALDEKPLFVQLNWGTDVREGRFLLRNEDHPTVRDPALGFNKSVLLQDQAGFKRKLSRRDRKEKKKRDKERGKENVGEESVAGKLYEDAPETSFTRSISNPEAVMRRRRQQKLERKLAQMNSGEGGSDSGGTLKIYGESLCPDVPYKTLFLSTADPASTVVREAMDKYGLEKEDPDQYCLVEVLIPPEGLEQKAEMERVLDDHECPLAIVIQHTNNKGHIIFELRKQSADIKKRQKPHSSSSEDFRNQQGDQRYMNADALPYLLEVSAVGRPVKHVLPLNVTEVINTEVAVNRPEYAGKHFIQLSGPDVHPRHCVIAHTEDIVTVTPTSQNAETYVEGRRIHETTILKHGMTVQFGRDNVYRFLDPTFEERTSQQPYQTVIKSPRYPAEASFDVEDTPSSNSQWESQQTRNRFQNSADYPTAPHDYDDLLPVSMEFSLGAQDRVLQACVTDVNSAELEFKLAPTYSLYLAARHLLSLTSHITHRDHLLSDFLMTTAQLIHQRIQRHHNDPSVVAFWMANCSEILHMFKHDCDIGQASVRCEELLAEAVQTAFHHLVRCLQGDLHKVMPAFLDPSDRLDDGTRQYTMGRPNLADVLETLSTAMTLLRRCRVNAALTIQLFSQLFHFINMWLFNILVGEPQLQLCTWDWGMRLKQRLGSVEAWAEKQGLELAADCHLCRIIQAAHLLQASKASSDDITNISSTCFKLNSLQLRSLLTHYLPEPHEPPVSVAFIERVVSIAENMADELTRTDGREVCLLEDSDLNLPFLLPEDGYSCETVRGIPNGLSEFVQRLEKMGICQLIINSSAPGSWTVYMEGEDMLNGHTVPVDLPPAPEMMSISLQKVNGSMGLSIVAAQGEGVPEAGIYIKSVVEGGAAELDGRLDAGDQLVEVDGKSLIGVSQDVAAELMTRTGQVVQLKVAKQAVLYHNLGFILGQPSITSQQGDPDRMRAPSTGHLAGLKPGQLISYPRDDLRSKSTSHLHVDTNLDHPNVSPQMKSAQSVGVLHHPAAAYTQAPADGSNPGINTHNIEIQPRYQSMNGGRMPHVRPGDRFVVVNQNEPRQERSLSSQEYQQPGMPPHRISDGSSLSSRASSLSNKDMRPQSAYYDFQTIRRDHPKLSSARPKSADVGSKLQEWHNKYDDPQSGYKLANGGNSPPYSNIVAQNREPPPQPTHNPPPKPTAHDRLFNHHSMPRKLNTTVHNRQQSHVYENTSHSSSSSFRSQQYPDEGHFKMAGKPGLTMNNQHTKSSFRDAQASSSSQINQPNRPQVAQQPTLMQHNQHQQQTLRYLSQPELRAGHRDQRYVPGGNIRPGPEYNDTQRSPQSPSDTRHLGYYPIGYPQLQYVQQTERLTYSPQDNRTVPQNPHFQQQQPFSDTNNHFDGATDFLPPASVLSGNLWAPHLTPEDPPPVPPPPSYDHLIEQKPTSGQQNLKQQFSTANHSLQADPRLDHRYSLSSTQQQQSGLQHHHHQQQTKPQAQQRQPSGSGVGLSPGAGVSVQAVASQPDYQNVKFVSDVRASAAPSSQTPSVSLSEVTPLNSAAVRGQGHQMEQVAQVKKPKVRSPSETNNRSAWDRDAKEQAEEEQQEKLFRARGLEISDLESRTSLSSQERERLNRLKTEHEFQRRVREIAEKGDFEYDDDEEFAERFYNRERLIQLLKVDLEKSRQRMQEFELSQQRADMAQEQDRLQTLERRLEMYEKDREEQKLRMQKRQERQIKEHQDQVRLQRETRERQRQNYEEHKQQLMKEEEKLNQRREEEINKRRQFERERRQELQDKRDEEEKRIREEIRREDQEQMQQNLAKDRQLRLQQNRPITVADEKRRLESLSSNHAQKDPVQTGSSQYANISSQSPQEPASLAPRPPERSSSYQTFTQNQQRAGLRNGDDSKGTPFAHVPSSNAGLPSAMRNFQEHEPASKKSVSFNTHTRTSRHNMTTSSFKHNTH